MIYTCSVATDDFFALLWNLENDDGMHYNFRESSVCAQVAKQLTYDSVIDSSSSPVMR